MYMNEHWALSVEHANSTNFTKTNTKYTLVLITTARKLLMQLYPLTNYNIRVNPFPIFYLLSPMCETVLSFYCMRSLNSIMSQINRIELFPWHSLIIFFNFILHLNISKCVALTHNTHLHWIFGIENLFNLLCFWLFSVFVESAFRRTSYSRAMK